MESNCDNLSLVAMQQRVDDFITANGGYWDALSQMLRLVEEVGELSREINHRFGAKTKKPGEADKPLADEFGDVLFVLIATANSTGVDLGQALDYVLNKYALRDAGRWTGGGQTGADEG